MVIIGRFQCKINQTARPKECKKKTFKFITAGILHILRGSLEKTHHSCTTNRQRGYSQSRRFKEANSMAWAHFRPTFN